MKRCKVITENDGLNTHLDNTKSDMDNANATASGIVEYVTILEISMTLRGY
jgi:hypothetical protein